MLKRVESALARRAPADDPETDELGLGRLWRGLIVGRLITALALCALLSLLPRFGPNRLWVAAGFALASMLQPVVVLSLARTRAQIPAIASVADSVVVIPIVVVLPDIYPWALIIVANSMAMVVLGLDRRFAFQQIAVCAPIYFALGYVTASPNWFIGFALWLVLSLSLIGVVGLVAQAESTARSRYETLLGGLGAAVWEWDVTEPCFSYVNQPVVDLLGNDVEHWREPQHWVSRVHPDDHAVFERSLALARANTPNQCEFRITSDDGDTLWLLQTVSIDESGDDTQARGVLLDISDKVESAEERERLSAFVKHSPLPMWIVGFDDPQDSHTMRFLSANNAACEHLGATLEEILAWPPLSELPDDEPIPDVMLETIEKLHWVSTSGVPATFISEDMDPAGNPRINEVEAADLGDSLVGVSVENVTERERASQLLRHQAHHDALTGLPNRLLINATLDESIERAARASKRLGLLMMDLDSFKEVNDALGHHHGDALLKEMSRRLESLTGGDDIAGRLGGDEFALILTGDISPRDAHERGRAITEAFSAPVQIDGVTVQTNVSVGIAIYPDHGEDAETLTRHADVAMYKAKSGGTGVTIYSAAHASASVRRLTLMNDLRGAIDRDELVVHYQPRLDIPTGALPDVEALVRWQHPRFGLLGPNEFIHLAEVSGEIQALTHHVLTVATRDIARLSDLGLDLAVAVNLSVRNMYDPALLDKISECLEAADIAPERLSLEITESELMDDPSLGMQVMHRVRDLGVGVSIDDFGTGYSSLSYLRDLPLTELKIDQSFVADMGNDALIVKTVIELAHNLELEVVAEGVETDAQLAQLTALGCDSAQGYLIQHPLPFTRLANFLLGQQAVTNGLTTP